MSAALTLDTGFKAVRMDMQDHVLGNLLAQQDGPAFEQVFKTHFKSLHAYAFTIVKDEDEAEEIVQQVFCKLWERAGQLTIQGSVAAYLYRSVHNESLNYLRHQKVKAAHQLHVAYSAKNPVEQPAKKILTKELEQKFQDALGELPEQCRTIFQLSRFDELKYREIAERLGISVKTVENQMGKALKLLRVKLVDYLPVLILFYHL